MNYFITFYFILSRYSPPSWDKSNYSGGITTITASTLCLLVLLYVVYSRRRDKKKQKEREIQFKNTLKTEGIKLTVSSDRCKVISKTYTIPNPYLKKMRYRRASMMDYVSDKVNYDEYIEVKECYIECGAKVNYSRKVFKSKAIKMDTKTLEIKLYLKKEIDIYYNPNTKKYFFDLDFLND